MKVGDTLTYSGDTWTGGPTSRLQRWQGNQVDIAGATAASYTVASADEGKMLRVGVRAVNATGPSAEVFSAEVGPVQAATKYALTYGTDSVVWNGAAMTPGIVTEADGVLLEQDGEVVFFNASAFLAAGGEVVTASAGSAARPTASGQLHAIPSVYSATSVVVGASEVPATVLGGSTGWIWFDPSDLSTLWQDDAGTVPVTAAGQPVARIDDKSGNGRHAFQTNAAARPTYQTMSDGAGGMLHYLASDGTDDIMLHPDLGFSDARYVALGFQLDSFNRTFPRLYSVSGTTSTLTDRQPLLNLTSNVTNRVVIQWGGNTDWIHHPNATLIGQRVSLTTTVSPATGTSSSTVNGVTVNGGYGGMTDGGAAARGNSSIFGTSFTNGRFFGLIHALTQPAQNDRNKLGNYMAGKAGVPAPFTVV